MCCQKSLINIYSFILIIIKNIMTVSIKLNKNIEDRLHYLSKETGRTISFYIREAIQSKLEDLEDIYLAEKALEDIRTGKSETYTLEEVKQSLGL